MRPWPRHSGGRGGSGRGDPGISPRGGDSASSGSGFRARGGQGRGEASSGRGRGRAADRGESPFNRGGIRGDRGGLRGVHDHNTGRGADGVLPLVRYEEVLPPEYHPSQAPAIGGPGPKIAPEVQTVGVRRPEAPTVVPGALTFTVTTNHFKVIIPEATFHHYDGSYVLD
jgi:hypothetical protein